MKKIINFRMIFFCFVAYLCAILFGKHFMSVSIFHIIFFSCLLFSLTVIAILRKQIWQMSAIGLCFALGFVSFYLDLNRFENIKIYEALEITTGRIVSVKNYSNSQSVILSQVTIGDNKSDNVSVYIKNGSFEIGDKITFVTKLETARLFSLGSFQSYIYSNNIKYTSEIDAANIIDFEKTQLTSKEIIRKSVRDLFHKFMNDDIAELSYSAMFGDRGNLSGEINTVFNESGIAHILSVSGMHVAFLVLLIDLILKKFKLNAKIRFIIFIIVLTFYMYLCDFQLTVVRASIMCFVLLLSNVLGKQYDSLNSIGIAGFLILFINPLSAFSIGFQLSFLCVFIIALFSGKLTRVLLKIKIPKNIASILAMTTCVQLGILPMIAKYFGSVSILSVLTNLLCVPLFEIAFIFTILFIIPVAIVSHLGFLLTFTSLIYQLIVDIAAFIASQTWAFLNLFTVSDYALLLFYVAIFFASGFVMLPQKHKNLIFILLMIFSMGFSALSSLPAHYDDLTIMQINNYSDSTLIIGENGTTVLLSNMDNIAFTQEFLKCAKIHKLDIVIMPDQILTDEQNAFLHYFTTSNILKISQNYSDKFLSIHSLQVGLNKYVLFIETLGHNIMYFNSELNELQNLTLQDYIYNKNINIIIKNNSLNEGFSTDFEITYNALKINSQLYGNLNNWLFTIKNGKINEIRSLN